MNDSAEGVISMSNVNGGKEKRVSYQEDIGVGIVGHEAFDSSLS